MVKSSPALSHEPPPESDRLMTVAEVTRLLHVSRSLIYWLIRRGELQALHIGHAVRIRPRDVQDYLQHRAELPHVFRKPKH